MADKSIKEQGSLLLVDDEQLILDVASAMLKRLGYTVHVADSGEDALRIYREKGQVIDLVILDMVMPGMSGGEIFDRLKAMNPGIKVILSSGYNLDVDATEIMARGCAGFIQKPFNLAQLSAKLATLLSS